MSIRDRHVVESLEPRRLLTAAPVLVGDINQTTDHIGAESVTPVGPISFFAGRPTEADGPELFRTDGTTTGTVLVKNINPLDASEPDLLTNVNGTLYFVADDGVHGRELWKSDGTAAGTTMVVDSNPGAGNGGPADLTDVNGTLYFTAVADSSGRSYLYRTDGTAGGTTIVRLAGPGPALTTPSDLVVYNGQLMLTASNSGTGRLYTVTGDVATPVGGSPSYARWLTVFNGSVYFRISDDNTYGDKRRGDLWKTDGTAAGTVSVASVDYFSGTSTTDFASNGKLTASGDRLYFISGNAINGQYAIWTSDGSTAGTRAAYSSSTFDVYQGLTAVGIRSVLFAQSTSSSYSLWATDGTLTNTRQLRSLSLSTTGSISGTLRMPDGRAMFTTQAAYGGVAQIYLTDGTPTGTTTNASIDTIPAVAYPVGLVNGKAMILSTRRFTDGGFYLSDGTAAGTSRFGATVAANASGLSDAQGYPFGRQFYAVGDTVYFGANDGNSGFELYRSVDGAGPMRVRDLNPGTSDSGPGNFVAADDGTLFFTTNRLSDSTSQLMRLDANGVVTQLYTGRFLPTEITPIGQSVYFKVGGVLWRWNTGQTAATTVSLTGQSLDATSRIVRAGSAWYFGAKTTNTSTNVVRQRLFRIDLATPSSIAIVTDIMSGDSQNYAPEPIGAVGSTLLFSAYTAVSGTELWKTDGTAAGTTLAADLRPGTASSSFETYNADYALGDNGVLYFGLGDGLNYSDLYRTDGTAAGTVKLAGQISARQLTNARGTIYFVGNIGTETGTNAKSAVYRVDGDAVTPLTSPGTGESAFNPSALLSAGDNIFVVGLGGNRARFELWRADGQFNGLARTAVLAPRVADAWGGTLTGFFATGRNVMTATSKDLYFPMYTDATGIELHRLPLATTGSVSGVVFDDANADGLGGAGDLPIAGDVLYVDTNANGSLDTGEPKATATVGGFIITGVPKGTYTVRRLSTTDGRRQTSPYAQPSGNDPGGPTGITVTVVAGQSTPPITFRATAKPPTVNTGTYVVDEGRSVVISGSASEAFGTIVKYEWDFNYDNAAFDADAVGQTVTFDATSIDGNSSRTIALRATDANGLSAIATSVVTINNVRPTAVFAADGPTTTADPAMVRFTNPTDVAADLPGLRYSFDFNNNGNFTDAGDVSLGATASASRVFSTAGTYTVRGRVTDKDGGFTDYTTNVVVTAADPAAVTLEGETATLNGGTAAANGNAGYTGTGYADFAGINSSAQWSITRVAGGAVTLGFRYANGGTTDRPLTILVNGVNVGTLSMPGTGSWTTWQTVTIATNLTAGANTIKAVASTSVGGANVDSLTVTRVAPAWLAAGSGAAYTLTGNTLTVTAGVVTLLADAGSTHNGLNVVLGDSANLATASSQHLGSLTLTGTAAMALTGAAGQLLRVTALNVATTSTLDLNAGDLIVDYSATVPPPTATIRGLIATARYGGAWTGTGLTSTAARTDSGRSTSLGILTAAEFGFIYGPTAKFAGEAIDESSLIVRYTLDGDTDLDRGVSINDFNRLSASFGATGRTWFNGDLDYDNDVSINDFNLLSANFGRTLPMAVPSIAVRDDVDTLKRQAV